MSTYSLSNIVCQFRMSLTSFHASGNGYFGNDPIVEGFVGSIRLAWVIHLMFIPDDVTTKEIVSSASNEGMNNLSQCLEFIC